MILRPVCAAALQPDLFPLHIHDTYVDAITLDRLHKKNNTLDHYPTPYPPLGCVSAGGTGYRLLKVVTFCDNCCNTIRHMINFSAQKHLECYCLFIYLNLFLISSKKFMGIFDLPRLSHDHAAYNWQYLAAQSYALAWKN